MANNKADPWLLIADGFHQSGGMEKANAALADYLVSAGIPVHLVAYSIDPAIETKSGLTASVARTASRFGFLGRYGLARLGHAKARRLTCHYPNAHVLVNGINCRWPDINWVHWVHRSWTPRIVDAPFWFQLKHRVETALAVRAEQNAFTNTKLLLANSERTRLDLINLLGVEPERIKTIFPGTDSSWREQTPEKRLAAREWLKLPNTRPVVCFVGALGYDSRKGFDTLWRAWKVLCALPQWDAELLVAGGGRALDSWRRQVLRSGLGARVRFLGFTRRVADVLAASDLLVSPARYESYGLNVQEALCFGVPAIVSANAGVTERFSTELDPLVLRDAEDSADLAARMLQWRRDPAGWKRAVEPTMKRLRAHTWEHMAEQIVDAARLRNGEPLDHCVPDRVDARRLLPKRHDRRIASSA